MLGDAARPAHVRPRPGRGIPRAVRHGVPARPARGGGRRGPPGPPRADDLPVAPPSDRVRRIRSEFRLYDFETGDGEVNEDVFAYSNRGPTGERSLVLVHNRYAETTGSARRSSGFARREGAGEMDVVRESLAEGLGLTGEPNGWLVLHDAMTGLEELRSTADIARDGFQATLAGLWLPGVRRPARGRRRRRDTVVAPRRAARRAGSSEPCRSARRPAPRA